MQMCRCAMVQIKCADMRVTRCADAQMHRYADTQMCRCEDVQMCRLGENYLGDVFPGETHLGGCVYPREAHTGSVCAHRGHTLLIQRKCFPSDTRKVYLFQKRHTPKVCVDRRGTLRKTAGAQNHIYKVTGAKRSRV